jgi:uncharacterized hydrophobic protein (TIGR00271 family)
MRGRMDALHAADGYFQKQHKPVSMQDHVTNAVFVYSAESADLHESLSRHFPDTRIAAFPVGEFLERQEEIASQTEHIVVSATMAELKSVIRVASEHDLSIGILPLESQKSLARYFRLPDKPDEQIELALGEDASSRDLILCNGELVLFKATIGRLPLIDAPESPGPWKNLRNMLARFRGIRLLGFVFDTAGGNKIETAASGCMIVQQHAGSLAARLIANDGSSSDGMISLVVAAPLSMVAYLSFLFRMLIGNFTSRGIPSTIGYIKSSGLSIDSEVPLTVDIDGEPLTRTPVKCEVLPGALRINTGPAPDQAGEAGKEAKERVDVRNLPIGNELTKAKKRAVPFFSYASEERFKDLFVALRDDARMSGAYVVLMILSTLLATIGLYQNSTSVVIGAMLLAPLMSPIVSLAMGILRYDQDLSRRSAVKVVAGVVLALASAVFITLLFPYKPVTNEMLARLSPSLLDLGVAIFAGVAGAYTKSYKEILQSLAGVAIAVALVPPLAVAGIGLGRGDPYFFGQAFLLFSTNLVGILVAATLTFRVLGYSAAIKSRRGLGYAVLALAMITVPLYFTYDDIVEKLQWERSWQKERFLVNGKYIIVRDAEIFRQRDRQVVRMDILARERLTRDDLNDFKEKIQDNFSRKLVIRANIIYIL